VLAHAFSENQATPTAAVTLPAVPEPTSAPEPEAIQGAFPGKRLRVQKKTLKREQPSGIGERAGEALPGVPEMPTDLRTSIRGTRLVELQWQGEGGEGTRYRIYRSATPWSCYGLVAEAADCRFVDTVPEAGTKNYYFVQAVREGRASPASAMAGALTFPALPPPEPPERLRAAPAGPDAVELRWAHARGAAAYVVYARMEGGDFQAVGHTLDGGFLHEGLPADASVDYRIQSYHDTGVSKPSAIVTVYTGAQPALRTGGQQRAPANNNAPRPAARPNPPPQGKRFPAFSLQGIIGP